MENGIKIIAISPPEFEKNFLPDGTRMSSVNSEMPYSLASTLSSTFEKIQKKVLKVINWQDPEGINESVFLLHYWQESQEMLREKIQRIQPDVFLIGTFAMNFRGAIEVARMIREISPRTIVIL